MPQGKQGDGIWPVVGAVVGGLLLAAAAVLGVLSEDPATTEEGMGMAVGTLVIPALLALVVRGIYTKWIVSEREFGSPWIVLIAGVIALIIVPMSIAGEAARDRDERAEDVASAVSECEATGIEPFPALTRYEYGDLPERDLAQLAAMIPEEMQPAFSLRTVEWRGRPFAIVGAVTIGTDVQDFVDFEQGLVEGAEAAGSEFVPDVINGVDVKSAEVPAGHLIVESGDCYARLFQSVDERSARIAAEAVVGR